MKNRLLSLLLFISILIPVCHPAMAQDNSLKNLTLTKENVDKVVNQLEKQGFAGVIYLKLNQIEIIKRAFGMANEELGIENSLNTMFDIGSRPIDFTLASVLLLDQQGKIDMSDPISKWFENVPEEKRGINILHLMSGRSGLPDRFHTSDDWDTNLAWIDRETAQQRIFAQPLLFEPGEGQHPSKGAFVLLSILIEKATGMDYFEFLNDNFFEPAGMSRTGEYGDSGEFTVTDFAEGKGTRRVGLPNIPPNWGPTSWLIRGSGGMYSTLEDLRKFYSYVRSVKVLDTAHNQTLKNPSVNVNRTERGFELFSAFQPEGSEAYLFLNNQPDPEISQIMFEELEKLVFALEF